MHKPTALVERLHASPQWRIQKLRKRESVSGTSTVYNWKMKKQIARSELEKRDDRTKRPRGGIFAERGETSNYEPPQKACGTDGPFRCRYFLHAKFYVKYMPGQIFSAFFPKMFLKYTIDQVLPLSNGILSFSLHFNGHFPDGPQLAGTRISSILDFIGAKDDGGGGDNWSCKTCKAPVKSSPPTNQQP